MSDVSFDAINPSAISRLRKALSQPTPGLERVVWLAIAACVVGLRWWVAVHLPTYVWTRDSGSYLAPAVNWLGDGQWITNARRGPVYSLFLAGVCRIGGNLQTVADVQAILGAAAVFSTFAFVRAWLGKKSLWPIVICAFFYVFYGMPLELERLIRNETLLVLFATLAFGAWFCGLRNDSIFWIALSGLFTGLMHLLKGIFPVFPVLVVIFIAWNWRRNPRRLVLMAGVYLALFLLPLVSSKLYDRISGTTRPAEPEDGEMFLGRTAQWIYLQPDGILPDLKARIHDQAAAYAERYQTTGKLDNNEIVKRTVVPTLKTVLVDERGGTLVDVNRVSWRLGLEAVAHHPAAYVRQFLRDLFHLNFISAQRMTPFEPKQLQDAGRDATVYAASKGSGVPINARIFDLEKSRAAISEAQSPGGSLQRFARFLRGLGRLRLLSPVFLTTILLPLLTYYASGRERLFWLGNLLLWDYYLILLSTVGRPLDRYLMPVVPIMFWTITTAASMAWQRWLVPKIALPEALPNYRGCLSD